MRKMIVVLASLAFLGLAFSGGAEAADSYRLKLGHTGAPSHHYQTICTLFAKKVAERTGGKVQIDVFPADQLGKQLESVEGVMVGTHDMVLASDTVLSNWVPNMGILNLPFLFNDLSDVRKVLDGPIGARLAKELEPHGAVVIGWWENGMRHVTNNKRPIKTPDDLKGMKIRVPEGEVFVETFKALGAGPTVVSFGELYSALQLGTVDGQENPPAHILTQKFYEVQKYASRTGHIHMSSPLIMNKALLDGMPQEYRTAILETARELGPVHTKMVEELEAEQWKEVKAHGMEVIDVDKKPFREKVKPVIAAYKKKLDASIIEDIEKTLQ
ncbi:MAG TPA: TRAP transporter substrate-binding protein [Desulfovibrio sp.]|uniref:TRAP transporter substrate-binding protein n=1 Tax=Desulfovibrio TaxID=872 RepID=UPI002A4D51D4|nr:TRAP transporter substrate-binding protein [Desulfovibrio sp.]MDY0307504.1 TRAP transporter substrate-binding protein [Desulfovibrionaceae bacterium]HMM38327.1 TRAP transporter substrate-binding protein [Desulfovibrio sp.]